ncbi:hypothetical protein ACL9RL_16005 [Plantibacter sp. Mn2098]|uniref:hypothetical protein n=1 Tax=Plantibacter sp. Mn2098 TaxID=3395266 RepID=UPI003BD86667
MSKTVIIVVFCVATIVVVATIGFIVAHAHERSEALFQARKQAEHDARMSRAAAADHAATSPIDDDLRTACANDEPPATEHR